MGATQDILANLDVDQIAGLVGSDPQEVRSAASTAIESLLGGVQNNLGDQQGAVSLANALGQHIGSPAEPSTPIDLTSLDFEDGAKIVNHVLGPDQQRQLFGSSQGSLVQKLLPLLAPIVLAYLAKRLQGGIGNATQTQGSGGLGSILGSVLGGGAGQASGGLGDVLGSILGGGQSGSPATSAPAPVPSGGGLGDILGQVLGGGHSPAATTPAAPASLPNTGGLQMPDEGADAAPAGTPAASAQGGGLGGLLKDILFGK